MNRWLRSLVAWRLVEETGVWAYWQNEISGKRRVTRVNRGGHQPIDGRWLRTGNWTPRGKPRQSAPVGGYEGRDW